MKDLQNKWHNENDAPGDFAGHRAAFDAMQGELCVPFGNYTQSGSGGIFPSRERFRAGRREPLAGGNRPGLHYQEEERGFAAHMLAKGRRNGGLLLELPSPRFLRRLLATSGPTAGFDAVIGNPPWDKIKPNERECLAEFDPTVWDVQGQERKRLIEALCRDNPRAQAAWKRHEAEA